MTITSEATVSRGVIAGNSRTLAREPVKQQAGEGVEIALHTEYLGGFTRVT
jgi:hypothetical protein